MTIFVHLFPFSACSWSIKTSLATQTNFSSSQDKLLIVFFSNQVIQILRLKNVVWWFIWSNWFNYAFTSNYWPKQHTQTREIPQEDYNICCFISVKSVFKSFKVRHSQNLNQSLTTMCLTTHKQPNNYKIGFVKWDLWDWHLFILNQELDVSELTNNFDEK